MRIVDRKKDMISVSGFKVFPNEVEEVAMSQGGLLECARRRRARSSIPARSASCLRSRRIPMFTADGSARISSPARLASYKVPKQIEFRDELPKTNVGKILRRALRDEPTPPPAN